MSARRIPTTVLLSQAQRDAIDRVRKSLPTGRDASIGDAVRLILDRGVEALSASTGNPTTNKAA